MSAKARLLERVTRLAEEDAARVLRMLGLLGDRRIEALATVPLDDETWTATDAAIVARAEANVAAGRVLTDEEIRREIDEISREHGQQ